MALQRQALALTAHGPTTVPAHHPVSLAASELWLAVYLPGLTERIDFEALAAWADCITPVVDLDTVDSLLLEVRGSIKLLGGLAGIKRMLADELESRGLAFHTCAAPTPLGALWLARHETLGDALEIAELPGCLGRLPVSVTRWPEPVLKLLCEIGVRSIGACMRLPRDGFARRVGSACLLDLDRALGKQPDPRAGFRMPPSFSVKIEFASETDDLEMFARAAEQLTERMAHALRMHQRQVQQFSIIVAHRGGKPTHDVLGLVEPVYQARRMLEPLLARLERLELPSPALSIEMRADAPEAAALGTEQLFEQGLGSRRSAAAEAELVERLRGRLGAAGVYGLELVAEHRPERVWSKSTDRLLQENAPSTGVSPWALRRPLWLLSSPAPLPEGLGRLCYRGPVRVEPDPERIESGWWDGREIRRDYHMAMTEQGERLWVYRDCATDEWYLHGIFG